VGLDVVGFSSPGDGEAEPGASTLSACFAGWLNDFLYKYRSRSAKNFVRKLELANLLRRAR
jgi:hypothetical protein